MLFHYYPAFVAQVVDASRVRVWLQHPKSDHINYDMAKTIVVDFDKTPSRCARWEDIELDDYMNHPDPGKRGFTTLGPVAAHNYGAGGIYLSAAYREQHEAELARALERPSYDADDDDDYHHDMPSAREYEYTAWLRRTDSEQVRFHGFHAVKQLDYAESEHRLILVCHAGVSYEQRAPRAVLVREADLGKPPALWRPIPGIETPAADSDRPIYLPRAIARVAGLEVRKLPSGCGDGSTRGVESPPTLVPGGPLNLSLGPICAELVRVTARLNGNWIPADLRTLAEQLAQVAASGQTFTSLDLIAHSRGGDGVLRSDDLALTANLVVHVFSDQVIHRIRQLGIRGVRFLGCRTACSSAGRAALLAVAERLNGGGLSEAGRIAVWGTRGDVFAIHYAPGMGFVEDRLLVGEDVLAGSVGDAPPNDDETIRETPPPAIAPVAGLAAFPLARDASSTPATQLLWGQPNFEALRQCVDFGGGNDGPATGSNDATLLAPVDTQILFVVEGTVRVFHILSNLRRIRLDYPDAWISYAVTDYTRLNQLIGAAPR